jgi:hypothetical protein
MASAARTGIVGAVVLIGVGLSVAAVLLLAGERDRLHPPELRVTEGEACDEGVWAIVIRDGDRRACLSLEDARALLALPGPFEYECAGAPVLPDEEPAGEPGAVDGPVAVAQIR